MNTICQLVSKGTFRVITLLLVAFHSQLLPSAGAQQYGWQPLSTGIDGGYPFVMTPYSENGQNYLVVGGIFDGAGGVEAASLARWDGATWSAMGTGFKRISGDWEAEGYIHALAVYDDGNGPALYAGGWFDLADGRYIRSIAKWDGTTWRRLGRGITNINFPNSRDITVTDLAVFDDGNGPALYVSGVFRTVDGNIQNLAKWNGSEWSAVGLQNFPAASILTSLNYEGTPALFTGRIDAYPWIRTGPVSKWDGNEWSSLSPMMNYTPPFWSANVLASYPSSESAEIFAGASTFSSLQPSTISKWTGTEWNTWYLNAPSASYPLAFANMYMQPDDTEYLIAAGHFNSINDLSVQSIAKWNGNSWLALTDASNALTSWGYLTTITSLAVFNDGNGPALYAGGYFLCANGQRIDRIAKLTELNRPYCIGDIADAFGLTKIEGGGPDGSVDFGDFVALLGLIGPCPSGKPGCLGDIADGFGLASNTCFEQDGMVDFGDFVALLGLIGPCP